MGVGQGRQLGGWWENLERRRSQDADSGWGMCGQTGQPLTRYSPWDLVTKCWGGVPADIPDFWLGLLAVPEGG